MLRSLSIPVRACAATLAVLWLALPLVGALHSGEHAHRYCAEHRAFEELDDEGLLASFARPGTESAVALADGEAGGDSHARCALAWAQARQVEFLPSGLLLTLPPSRQLLLLGESVGEGCGVPLLALAPKGSPPGR
ncbi:hypothetical protein LXT21_01060 [Myxococcus sp. K38C18041901]|uniref:hypothetical protein n=1 Tax=Myxococcus guangdongensis TaxID=2906760 RepID=UPI0020A78F5F|nr:hypothetical protein [Myxococcus guangdongensis]MCP3057360.1 hypothetical protein [Myxococcus guangdongensis]